MFNMEKIYNVTEFAEMIGKSVKTLQRWDREGILTAYRSPSKRRYYTHTQYLEYMGESPKKENMQNVIYARVSTRNQKDDLKNQVNFLIKYCNNLGIPIDNIYTDFGSGLNYNRKNWNKMIDDVFDGKIQNIYIAHDDRFVRFGFKWIIQILEKYGNCKVVSVNNIALTPEEEVIKDLISIIHVFSCRVYGLRKYKNKIEKELDNA